jgi:hypothetical protein
MKDIKYNPSLHDSDSRVEISRGHNKKYMPIEHIIEE